MDTSVLREDDIKKRPVMAMLVLLLGCAALLFGMSASISLGAADIDFRTVWQAVLHPDLSQSSHQIIQDIRLPRAIASALVGAFLAVSGAVMQGLTRNPLAEPAIMGVTDGAAFAIAAAFAFFPGGSAISLMVWAFLGAGLGALLVFSTGSLAKGGLSPVKLALAGTAIGAMLRALSTALAIHFHVAQDISFWFAGGVAGTTWTGVHILVPVGVIGFVLALMIARSVTVLSFGEEVAKGLGQRIFLVKLVGVIVVLLLTGAAVSIAGSVGFLGLVVPHITRMVVGPDYRYIIPCSAVLGALLLVLADLGARMVNAPFETPVGAITALIGVPFFLYLVRREGKGLL